MLNLFAPPTDREIEQRKLRRVKNCDHYAYSFITAKYADMTFRAKNNPVEKVYVNCGICNKQEEITEKYDKLALVNPAIYFSRPRNKAVKPTNK